MARIKMVTRTVDITVVKVMCLNMESMQGEVCTFEVTGLHENNDIIMKLVKKLYETDTLKPVAVVDTEIKEVLYGMTELDFIKLAKVLPPRTGNKEE